MKKLIYMFIGCITLALGAIGTAVPVLPTVPFLLCSTFCFAKSSQRLYTWFTGTKLYKDNLESYVKTGGMTKQAKMRIMMAVSLTMAVGFGIMFSKAIYLPCMILMTVWVCHVLYFVFGIKTIKA